LSIIFVYLFFPIVRDRYEAGPSLVYTGIGVCVIWGSYVVRAYIFTRPGATRKNR
jgi:hypothetical protein